MACITKTTSTSLPTRPIKPAPPFTRHAFRSCGYDNTDNRIRQDIDKPPVPYGQQGDLLLYTESQLANDFQREQLVRALHGHHQRASGDRQILHVSAVEFDHDNETRESDSVCLLQPLVPEGSHGCLKIGLLIGNLTVKKFSLFRGANYGSIHFTVSPHVQLFLQRLGKKFKITYPSDLQGIKVRCELDSNGKPTWRTYEIFIKSTSDLRSESSAKEQGGVSEASKNCTTCKSVSEHKPHDTTPSEIIPLEIFEKRSDIPNYQDHEGFEDAILMMENSSNNKKKKMGKNMKKDKESPKCLEHLKCDVKADFMASCQHRNSQEASYQPTPTGDSIYSTYSSILRHRILQNVKPCNSLDEDIFVDLKKRCIPGQTQVEALIHLGHVCPYQKSNFLILFLRELRLLTVVADSTDLSKALSNIASNNVSQQSIPLIQSTPSSKISSCPLKIPETVLPKPSSKFRSPIPSLTVNRVLSCFKDNSVPPGISLTNRFKAADNAVEAGEEWSSVSSRDFLTKNQDGDCACTSQHHPTVIRSMRTSDSQNDLPVDEYSTFFNVPEHNPLYTTIPKLLPLDTSHSRTLRTSHPPMVSARPVLKHVSNIIPAFNSDAGSREIGHPKQSSIKDKKHLASPFSTDTVPSSVPQQLNGPINFCNTSSYGSVVSQSLNVPENGKKGGNRVVFPCNVTDLLHPRNVKMQRMLKSLVAHEAASVFRLSSQRRMQQTVTRNKNVVLGNDLTQMDFESSVLSLTSSSLSEEEVEPSCSHSLENATTYQEGDPSLYNVAEKPCVDNIDSGTKPPEASNEAIFSVGDFVQIGKVEGRRDILENQTAEIISISDKTTSDGTLHVTVSLRRIDGTRFQGQHNPIREDIPATSLKLVNKSKRQPSVSTNVAEAPSRKLQNFKLKISTPLDSNSSKHSLPLYDTAGNLKVNYVLNETGQNRGDLTFSGSQLGHRSLVREPFTLCPPRTSDGVLCFFWDLEATGLRVNDDDITQIACVCRRFFFSAKDDKKNDQASFSENASNPHEFYSNDNVTGYWETVSGYPDKEFNCYVYTDRVIPEPVVQLTGITNEFLEKYGVSFDKAVMDWASWISSARQKHKNCPVWFVAHNGNRFDLPLLFQQEICKLGQPAGAFLSSVGTVGIVDTVVLSRRLPWANLGHARRSHKLQTLYFDVFHQNMPNEHDALGDVVGLAALMDQDPFLFAWSNVSVGWTLSEYLIWSRQHTASFLIDIPLKNADNNALHNPDSVATEKGAEEYLDLNHLTCNNLETGESSISHQNSCSLMCHENRASAPCPPQILSSHYLHESLPNSLSYDYPLLTEITTNGKATEEESHISTIPLISHFRNDLEQTHVSVTNSLPALCNTNKLRSIAFSDNTHSAQLSSSSPCPFDVVPGFALPSTIVPPVSGTTHVFSQPVLQSNFYQMHQQPFPVFFQNQTFSNATNFCEVNHYKEHMTPATPSCSCSLSFQSDVVEPKMKQNQDEFPASLLFESRNKIEDLACSDPSAYGSDLYVVQNSLHYRKKNTFLYMADKKGAPSNTLDFGLLSSPVNDYDSSKCLTSSNFAYTMGGDRIESPWSTIVKSSQIQTQATVSPPYTVGPSSCSHTFQSHDKSLPFEVAAQKSGASHIVNNNVTSDTDVKWPLTEKSRESLWNETSLSNGSAVMKHSSFNGTKDVSHNHINQTLENSIPDTFKDSSVPSYINKVFFPLSRNSQSPQFPKSCCYPLALTEQPQRPSSGSAIKQQKNTFTPWIPRFKGKVRCPSTILNTTVTERVPHHTFLWSLRSQNMLNLRPTERQTIQYSKKTAIKQIKKSGQPIHDNDKSTGCVIQKPTDSHSELDKTLVNSTNATGFSKAATHQNSPDKKKKSLPVRNFEHSNTTSEKWNLERSTLQKDAQAVPKKKSGASRCIVVVNSNSPYSSSQNSLSDTKYKPWTYINISHHLTATPVSQPTSSCNVNSTSQCAKCTTESKKTSLSDPLAPANYSTQCQELHPSPKHDSKTPHLHYKQLNHFARENSSSFQPIPPLIQTSGNDQESYESRSIPWHSRQLCSTPVSACSLPCPSLRYSKTNVNPASARYVTGGTTKAGSMKGMKILKRGTGDCAAPFIKSSTPITKVSEKKNLNLKLNSSSPSLDSPFYKSMSGS